MRWLNRCLLCVILPDCVISARSGAREQAGQVDTFGTMDESASSTKTMSLRYAGTCRECGAELAAGTTAIYDRLAKAVQCITCQVPEQPVFGGVAGASAQREHDRRALKRETRIRESHPVIGGLLLAISDDPHSTKAWAIGASGEEALGRRLDSLVSDTVRVLHDRRIPGTKANIDHIVVCPTGVFAIDAKKYSGRPNVKVEGGFFSPVTRTLMVGSRNCTKLVHGVHKQVGLLRAALEKHDFAGIPVGGMLCFVEADWPLIGGDFVIDGLSVLWPRKAASRILKPGTMDAATIDRVHRALALAFPPA